ncbi:MAG: hypothetical protein QG649_98 [Patescibacteria group bacterium]|jgi:hypothetical protein|nr:hypothetical protein [Patescibacteria group bacterium]
MKRGILWVVLFSLIGLGGAWNTHAATFSSPNYTINGNLGDSAAGAQTSTNYSLTSSAGESINGAAASASYKLGQGYIPTLDRSMQLSLNPSTINLGALTPGVSNAVDVTATILTDAPGYALSLHQDADLTGPSAIPAIAGSINSPISWSEGSTKGLGFSLVSTNATPIDSKWNSGNSYAALPGLATDFYSRIGYNGGSADTLTARIRLDVLASQLAGSYSNAVTWTGTITP